MKEPLKKKPPGIRIAKIDRRHESSLHEDSHLWAVSYADFLMVLLCFFIIFFSTDEQKKDDIIQKIFLTFEHDQKVDPSHSPSRGLAAIQEQQQQLIEKLQNEYPDAQIQIADRNSLLIHFADGLYAKGGFEVTGPSAKTLNKFLQDIMPFKEKIELTFIGHADSDRVRSSPNKAYRDNFDLSALRATRALQFAIRLGYPDDSLVAQGSGKNHRSTRSLSVLIKGKKDIL